MNASKNLLRSLTLAALVFFPWCSAGFAQDEITVASLNLEWLGHGNNSRTMDEIRALASYIGALEVDVLVVQEVSATGDRTGNGIADWTDLLSTLGPNFDGAIGTAGRSQRLGVIWRTGRVQVTDVGELSGITREPVDGVNSFPRLPFTTHVRSLGGGVDFRMIVVHLYWGSNAARRHEATQLSDWLRDYLSGPDDEDVILIGDCNTKSMGLTESGNSQTIDNLESGGDFTCVSDDHHEATTPTTGERYDHVFLSSDMLNHEFVASSFDVRREACEAFPTQYLQSISNHCPISVRFRDTDDDTTTDGDWGLAP